MMPEEVGPTIAGSRVNKLLLDVYQGSVPWPAAAEVVVRWIAEEREACAKVADAVESDERQQQSSLFGTPAERLAALAAYTARKVATSIRARNEAP